jgi:hypothetical protein
MLWQRYGSKALTARTNPLDLSTDYLVSIAYHPLDRVYIYDTDRIPEDKMLPQIVTRIALVKSCGKLADKNDPLGFVDVRFVPNGGYATCIWVSSKEWEFLNDAGSKSKKQS